MATAGRKYTGAFVASPGNVRQRSITRAAAAAGDLTALSTAKVAVIIDADGTTPADKVEILNALRAIERRVSRDFNSVSAPAHMSTVTGAALE